MSDFIEIKKFVQNNHEDLIAMLDSVRLSIVNDPIIKILHSRLLNKFWTDRPNKKFTFVIYFDESQIKLLNQVAIEGNLFTVITERLKTHSCIQVNNEFAIISNKNEINHDSLINLSNENNVVFYFGENGIDVFVRGKIFPRINVFYGESERVKYSRKFHISELQECLKEYEIFINTPGINEAFFANKTLVHKLQPKSPPINILINKPENTLRNNLLLFLNSNTQHDFVKENELNNKRELDLYAEIDFKKYLIEVKWLGQSINDDDSGFTKNITDYAARNGVKQTLEYIQELIERMNFNVHCGYLCVFDARDNKNPIDYGEFKFVTKELTPYYKKHFIKLDEIALERNH